MRRKRLYISILSIVLLAVLFVVYKVKTFNVFSIDVIELPQEEKFDIEILKIEKYKVWEMKNVYANNGDYWFENWQDGKRIVRRFYMVNKEVEDVDDFVAKFMPLIKFEYYSSDEIGRRRLFRKPFKPEYFSSDEIVVKYFFYRKSKMLPKYWTPVWSRFCLDYLGAHEDDLLFVVTTDTQKNILDVDVPFLEK